MKVLLINPPAMNTIEVPLPQVVEEEKGYVPPLGLMYVATYVKENSDHQVSIIDAMVEELNYKDLKERIKKEAPEVVGMTAMSFTMLDILLTAQVVKEIDPDIKVVLGGPHVNLFPNETISLKNIDFLVLGEGEFVFNQLLESLERNSNLSSIAGLVFQDNGRIVNTGMRSFIENLDKLPFPDRRSVPYTKYTSVLAKAPFITTMITSRGCPYKCLFCDRPQLGKRFRARTAKNVVDEMEKCYEMGIKEIFIYDDTFTVNRERVIDICEEIKRRNLRITWDIRARVDTVNMEMLQKLKEAGCERIHYGVEAGTNEILKKMRKGITVDQVRNTFAMTKKVGITTLGYFMLGFPLETRHHIMETTKLAIELRPDYAHFSITTPYPGTELYQLGMEEELIKSDYWREFAEAPTKEFVPKFWEENFTHDELLELLEIAYRKFYRRSGYIVKGLCNLRSIHELKKKCKMGLRLLRMK